MIISGAARYQIPLRKALPVRGQLLASREILRITAKLDGQVYHADCAPLPGFHSESLDDCEQALREGVKVSWSSQDPKRPRADTPLKSLKSALEILHLLPSAREFRLERSDRFQNSQLLRLPSLGEEADFFAAIDASRPVMKVKFGRQDMGRERELMQEIRRRVPAASFRLDANQGLSQAEFCAYARAFQDLPIAYYEEPCRDPDGLIALCRDYPIALDESLGHSRELRAAAAAWVLKPNLHGFAESLDYFVEANRLRRPLVMSNAFESRTSLQAYAWFYGLLVPSAQTFGFGTVDYLVDASDWDLSNWPSSPGGEA